MTYRLQSNLLLLALLLCAFSAQSQDILWEKSYGGKHAEFLFDAIPTPDYGFILAGSSISNKNGNKTDNNKGDLDYWVWKMDEKGDLDWQKSFGGSGTDLLQSIKLTKDAGFILAGTSTSNKSDYKSENSKGNADFWIIKLDAKGGELWQKTIGGAGEEKLQTITGTRDGGFIIGGSSSSGKSKKDEKGLEDPFGKSEASRGNLDYWVVKLSFDGKIEWQKTIGGQYIDELKSIEQTTDGGYILGGYSNSPISGEKTTKNMGIGDYWIVKLDKNGFIEWQKTIGGDKDDNLSVLIQTKDGGFIAGGNSNSGTSNNKNEGNTNGTDFWVVKFDHEGSIIWQKTYNYGDADILTSLVQNPDGTFLIGGYAKNGAKTDKKVSLGKKSSNKNNAINDFIALKINALGEEIWTKSMGSAGDDVLKRLIETRDGGYLLAGTSNPQSVDYSAHSSGSSNSSGLLNGANSPNTVGGAIDKAKQNLEDKINKDNAIARSVNELNSTIKDKVSSATTSVSDAVNKVSDSRLKFGLNSPTEGLGLPGIDLGGDENGANGAGGSGDSFMNQKKLPPSGDKKNNLGSSDFWVVKLKDKTKSEKVKVTIEALPNPVDTFTNIIINYEYVYGTATLYDLNGRLLQESKLNGERTIPFDMSRFPRGVYIINVATNVERIGIKVIKE